MKLIVNPHKIIIEKTPVNEKEVNVTEIEFEFNEEITNNYVKEAYFTLNNNSYKQIITNNKCNIPSEVLTEKGQIEIGVVAYLVENQEEIKRYNPSPVYINTWKGSIKNANNVQPITPTDKEQIQQEITNLENNKQDTLISGTNIKTINNESILGNGNIKIQGSGGTSDYIDLENKPQINGVTLTGNKTTSDLGIVIPDVSNFITKDVNNLTYYTKTSDLPTIPTNVSAFTNDAGYLTQHQDISGKLDTNKVKSTYSTTSGDVYDVTYINSTIGDIESLLGGI